MGCASSKVLGSEFAAEKGSTGFSKGISMPSHPQVMPDDFHIVALMSSTYGILKVDPPKPLEEDSKDGMGAHSVKDVLNKLKTLESKEEAAPQSWLEVSSMLENLKPELEKPTNAKTGIKKPQQPDAIDIKGIMMDLDEETGLVRPKARQLANLRKTGRTLPIHTLEELEKRFGGKENIVNNGGSPVVSIADVRASLKPVGTAKASVISGDKKSNAPMHQNDQQKPKSATVTRDGVITKDSELIDDEFLGSYKNAFDTFSDDDWKAVEMLCQNSKNEEMEGEEDEKHVIAMPVDMGVKEEHSASSDLMFTDVFLINEIKKLTSLPTAEVSLKELTMPVESTSPKLTVASKSPLDAYEELCPPGGKQAVVLYTTSLRGIRKTYEDCIKAREILQSYGVLIDERDVSMHLEYRNELRELMQRVVTVPRLFIKGRYIGGAEVIAKLAEEGQLASLLEGSTRVHGGVGAVCEGCGGAKFVPCLECSGSCKVVNDRKQVMRCFECNENGLIECPICS